MRLRNIPGAAEKISAHPSVIQTPEDHKGHFHDLFPHNAPLRIEIGMGKGQFIINMAKKYPDINFLGIERYDSVLLRALEKYDALENPPENLYFLSMDAINIAEIFDEGEIDRIYLNFSDPWPKARHAKRRLTSERFLPLYKKVLKKDGEVHFKTDNQDLFTYSLESIKENHYRLLADTRDLHNDSLLNSGNIMTEYEEKFSQMGNPICKLIATPTQK